METENNTSYIDNKPICGGCGHKLFKHSNTKYMVYPELLIYVCPLCKRVFKLNASKTELIELKS